MSRLRLSSILLSLVLAFAAGGFGTTTAVPATGAEAATPPPNIIVVLTDDQPYDLVPDHPGTMPWLEGRLADSTDHWTTFTNAFVNTSLCCPARATMLTGQYSHVHGVQANFGSSGLPALDVSSTLATWLHDAGYRTGFFGKYFNSYRRPSNGAVPPGWDRFLARASNNDENHDIYYDYDVQDQGALVQRGSAPDDYSTDVYGDAAVRFIKGVPSGQPFFAYFNPQAPHEPVLPAPRHTNLPPLPHDLRNDPNFNELDVSDKPEWVRARTRAGDATIAAENNQWQNSYRAMRAVDEKMRDMWDAVAARGQLDNTVIVFLTDNGFSLRHHRVHGKRCPYDVCTRTPLFVRVPGAAGGSVRTRLASNVDIVPTLLELAGATADKPMNGRSLLPVIQNTARSWRSAVLIRWFGDTATGANFLPSYWAARSLDYLYVEYDHGERELYDVRADPYQLQNRAGDPAYAAAQSSMATTLASLKGGPAPSDTTKPTISITTPATNATYSQNQVVNAKYACADEAGGSGLATCSGPVPSGSPIDTATAGTRTFTVTARDNAGNQTTASRTYTVTSSGGTNSITVTKSGTGAGRVGSSDRAIVCGTDCTQTYASPTTITLTAAPDLGSAFTRWTGEVPATCTTGQQCTLTVQGSLDVTAVFTLKASATAAGKPLP